MDAKIVGYAHGVAEVPHRELRLDHRQHRLYDLAHRQRLEMEVGAPRLDARQIEQIVDEPEQMLLTSRHSPQRLELFLREWAMHPHLEKLDIPSDRIERCPQLVAHRREERALRA